MHLFFIKKEKKRRRNATFSNQLDFCSCHAAASQWFSPTSAYYAKHTPVLIFATI